MSYDILLIDDNEETSENVLSVLELAGYSARYASDGRKGVSMVHERKPDLIICDIMMPHIDGFGVLHILRKNLDTAKIPFVFLTARADPADFRAGMNLGADDYIVKPFHPMDLLNVIEVRLRRTAILQYTNGVNVDPAFSEIKEASDLQSLLENKPIRTIRKKEFVFLQGQTPGDLFYVVEGKVKTSKLSPDGKELITGIYYPGNFFGYVSIIGDHSYQDNAEVLEDASIAVIPRSEFLNLMYSSREVARRFMQLLSRNLTEMELRLLDVAYQSVRQRAASILLQLHSMAEPESNIITLTRKDMSSIVGTAPESFNRTIADFKDEGIIDVTVDGVRIVDRKKLERALR